MNHDEEPEDEDVPARIDITQIAVAMDLYDWGVIVGALQMTDEFAAYGEIIDAQILRARAAAHEVAGS